ncbi:phage shock envelope stress response protein PspM [Nakamurella endophytica]|uniref:Uncharacterized protein n=1 Tax=Nakamurella endophytica TaxID=1748367 RepID=A0A917WL90_9ACTN|nr:hypothetical protein [Nakamurella endophytica]GGM13138.1 hypothetical protein GCM10011594_36300 [Nakamurella endophytica]
MRRGVVVGRRVLRSGGSRVDRVLLARGLDVAGQVGAAAGEIVRTRREPALVALRRQRAARRRLTVWGAGTVVGAGGAVGALVPMLSSGATTSGVFLLVVCLGLLLWAGAGAVRAVHDLRLRSRVVAALPPPQPSRTAVAGEIRGPVDRLNKMSDDLRHLVAMIGVVDEPGVLALRRDVVEAADEAEQRLRRIARELTGVLRARRSAPADARPSLEETAGRLRADLDTGVAEYGELVGAATHAVEASRQLSTRVFAVPEVTDRLQALATGMRELSEG